MNKSTKAPRVTVLMPVYNGERFVKQAVRSILYQKLREFELLIIDDGSTDRTGDIIKKLADKDSRIRIITNKENKGVADSLNIGVNESSTELVARMDADDISLPKRLAIQVKEMENHKNMVLVGCGFEIIDENGKTIDNKNIPVFDEDLRRAMWVRNPFAHGSVVYRKPAVLAAGGYKNDVGPIEDYDLWLRLAALGPIYSVPYFLYKLRLNKKGVSLTKNDEQQKRRDENIENRWNRSYPETVPRKQIIDQNKKYIGLFNREYAVEARKQTLADLVQIGIKLMKNKKLYYGAKQIAAVASSGRTGAKTAFNKLTSINILSAVKKLIRAS